MFEVFTIDRDETAPAPHWRTVTLRAISLLTAAAQSLAVLATEKIQTVVVSAVGLH